MKKDLVKLIFAVSLIFTTTVQPINVVMAQPMLSCGGFNIDDVDTLSPILALCVFVRVLNVMIWSTGGFTIVMFSIAAYKFAAAQGDPSGILGAKMTFSNAVLGSIIILSAGTMLAIARTAVGITTSGSGGALLGLGAGDEAGIFQQLAAFICIILRTFVLDDSAASVNGC